MGSITNNVINFSFEICRFFSSSSAPPPPSRKSETRLFSTFVFLLDQRTLLTSLAREVVRMNHWIIEEQQSKCKANNSTTLKTAYFVEKLSCLEWDQVIQHNTMHNVCVYGLTSFGNCNLHFYLIFGNFPV